MRSYIDPDVVRTVRGAGPRHADGGRQLVPERSRSGRGCKLLRTPSSVREKRYLRSAVCEQQFRRILPWMHGAAPGGGPEEDKDDLSDEKATVVEEWEQRGTLRSIVTTDSLQLRERHGRRADRQATSAQRDGQTLMRKGAQVTVRATPHEEAIDTRSEARSRGASRCAMRHERDAACCDRAAEHGMCHSEHTWRDQSYT